MIKQKIKVKILSCSSIRLGRGRHAMAINRPNTLQTVTSQNNIKEVTVALYKSYKST